MHYSTIQGEGYKKLLEGEEVTFDIVQGEKGPQATNVVRQKKSKEGQQEGQGGPPAASASAQKKGKK